MFKMFKHSKGCSSSHASSTSSSEPNANLYRLVILLSYLGHLPSLHFFFLQGVGAWSSKLKWNVWLDFKANISWNLTNCALEISYSYIHEKRLLLMFQLSFENLMKDLNAHFFTCFWYQLSTTLHDKEISYSDM
jgi:hypothetical protein